MESKYLTKSILENVYAKGLLNEADDVDFREPTGYFSYEGKDYPYWGNQAGRNRTVDYDQGKFNRYAKLGNIADQLLQDFKRTVQNAPNTAEGRCAYASILMM